MAVSLVFLTLALLLTAQFVGLVPDDYKTAVHGRSRLCETLAVHCALLVERGADDSVEYDLRAVAARNPEIRSLAIRGIDGRIIAQVGDHAARWPKQPSPRNAATHIVSPIVTGGRPLGTVEAVFNPLREEGVQGLLTHPLLVLAGFLAGTAHLAFTWFLRKVLRMVNAARVVPHRVKNALDTLAEGLLVIDHQGRIVLANRAFAQTIGRSPDELLGRDAGELPWLDADDATLDGRRQPLRRPPWLDVIQDGQPRPGRLLAMALPDGEERTFIVNSTPVRDEGGRNRGVLASFEDVTPLQEKKAQLSAMLYKLRESSEEIRRQNQELERLARQDPLTGCLNRRSFFELFETHWETARRYNHALSAVMVDVDRFKLINDNHGHSVGDAVLQKVAATLRAEARTGDMVCRYGGEEFAVLLPHVGIDEAAQAGERFRRAIADLKFPDLSVTASVGVAEMSEAMRDPQELLEQADKCLYLAKHGGRNQTVRWDEVPEDVEIDESQIPRAAPATPDEERHPIPFQAVTALISALAYRDLQTAEHSRRVADLCVAVAEGLLSPGDCYVLENAALLHDIGKIGVPDSILLKPGPLTREEWEVMQKHETIGSEIIRASFNCRELSEIVENHHAWYGFSPEESGLPTGEDIPLGARILTVADAYDSMVSDRVYRKGRSPEEAFAELRRCAGAQFDPQLVERFIECVSERSGTPQAAIGPVSKQTALNIGQQIERLAFALEKRDKSDLHAITSRLKATAARDGVREIAEKAGQLESSLEADADLLAILNTAGELMDLCRSTQMSYLPDSENSPHPHPPQ